MREQDKTRLRALNAAVESATDAELKAAKVKLGPQDKPLRDALIDLRSEMYMHASNSSHCPYEVEAVDKFAAKLHEIIAKSTWGKL